jgi:hypothetical protein
MLSVAEGRVNTHGYEAVQFNRGGTEKFGLQFYLSSAIVLSVKRTVCAGLVITNDASLMLTKNATGIFWGD